MSDMSSAGPFPRGVLLGAAALLAFTIVAAGVSRWTGLGSATSGGRAAISRDALHFEDRGDGAVVIYAADSAQPIEVLEPGTNGFIRSVLRGLARERRARGIGSEPPFYLTHWQGGRLSLEDPATGRFIELGAFGPSNAGAFAGLLARAGATP